MRNTVLYGDCLTRLREIPDGSVQCCVTSPPYWGLRDYGTRRWFGGDPACEHDRSVEHGPHHPGQVEQTKWSKAEAAGKGGQATTHECSKCGAWWGQLGLEPTPELYVRNMVEVFREVRRVLRKDGIFWLNIGDSYANRSSNGIKPKDLVGIPWMLAFALRAAGWWLRQDNIWHKPNVMPESVLDRSTRAHEQIFMLTKSARYFYDADAIREPCVGELPGTTRNKRSVWSINTQAYKGAHFAVMPPELASTCIRASSKPGDLVLDPFAGSGTTLMVAKDLGRDFLGVELNEAYRPLIEARVSRAIEQAAARELFQVAWRLGEDG
jgi:DNA modification methylase